MSLQLILGNSGSGKSYYLYERILKEAEDHPNQVYMVIVPEQFTMQTQMDLVRLSPNHVIMNVEVLSFRRLAYRIFEELGWDTLDVLEETGKNLVIRRVAEQNIEKLPLLGNKMKRPGYITEVRSLLSEFNQYRISPETVREMGELSTKSDGKVSRNFQYKMQEIEVLYQGFLDFLSGKYITAEEVLELLEKALPESQIMKNSVVSLDGFTGFTPTQNAILREMFSICSRVDVSITIDERENFTGEWTEEELFAMPKEMISSLHRIASSVGAEILEPIIIPSKAGHRFLLNGKLSHLEKNIFRDDTYAYTGNDEDEIQILSCQNPREELRMVCESVREHMKRGEFSYREIAIVTPNLDGYREYAKDIFSEYDIPLYLDVKITPSDHPLMELIRGFMGLMTYDFSRDSVMGFLRSGIEILPADEVDQLDNYLIATGARGKSVYSKKFQYRPAHYNEEECQAADEIREKFWNKISPSLERASNAKGDVRELATALYEFLDQEDVEQDLLERAGNLEERGENKRAHIYRVIFKEVMNLLTKMVALLSEDEITPKEFIEIFDAGVDTLKIGTIPNNNDMVILGDLERTRLHEIKILYVVGANDAYIPKDDSRGGILSEYERQVLEENDFELSPTARTRAFRQKYYLYSVLTKPSRELVLSFSTRLSDGSSAHPAYIISEIQKLFPELFITPYDKYLNTDFYSRESIRRTLIDLLKEERNNPDGTKNKGLLKNLLQFQKADDEETLMDIIDQIYFRHKPEEIDLEVWEELGLSKIDGSVSRFETYATCPYRYFLQYDLSLHERDEHEMNQLDVGNVYHDVMNTYSRLLLSHGKKWGDYVEDQVDEYVEESIQAVYESDSYKRVYTEARSEFRMDYMKENIKDAIQFLHRYAAKGTFVPKHFEIDLSEYEKNSPLESLIVPLSNGKGLHFRGRVDRIDTMEKDGTVYIRVIDYKTGESLKANPNRIAGGLDIQLLFYMNAVMEGEQKKAGEDKNVLPGEIVYYHVVPTTLSDSDIGSSHSSEEEFQEDAFKKTVRDGIVNDAPDVIHAMDQEQKEKSSILPKQQDRLNEATFKQVLGGVKDIISETAECMENGEISVKPYKLEKGSNKSDGCGFCPYHAICGFDEKLPGYEYRKLETGLSWEDIGSGNLDDGSEESH